MLERLAQLETEALQALEQAGTLEDLDRWYHAYLGRKGALTAILRSVGSLPPEERPAVGQRANEIKRRLEAAYNARAEVVRQEQLAREVEAGALDVTLPGRPVGPGHLHLTTRTLRQIYAIFAEMGFQVYEARDVETDEMNFGLLNMPPHHPAREMWDTFWISERATHASPLLLRTHTSPGQIRGMRARNPGPLPGRRLGTPSAAPPASSAAPTPPPDKAG